MDASDTSDRGVSTGFHRTLAIHELGLGPPFNPLDPLPKLTSKDEKKPPKNEGDDDSDRYAQIPGVPKRQEQK